MVVDIKELHLALSPFVFEETGSWQQHKETEMDRERVVCHENDQYNQYKDQLLSRDKC